MPSKNLKPPLKPTYTQVFGKWLCDRAAADSRLVAITPAMREGSGLVEFEQRFPDAISMSVLPSSTPLPLLKPVWLAGMKPVVAIYSTFLQRAYDQLVHDIALQNFLPVLFAVDRAGIVGADGPTHRRSVRFELFALRAEHDCRRAER